MTTSQKGLKQRVFLAFKENLILTLYLWAVFLLIVVYKSTILAEQHIDFVYHGAALINALAFSKVILVARKVRSLCKDKRCSTYLPDSSEVSVLYGCACLFQDS